MTEGTSVFTPEFVRRGAPWLRGEGSDTDVVLSSRIRLARNLAGQPFLCKTTRNQREEILERCRARIMTAGLVSGLASSASSAGGGMGVATSPRTMYWVGVHATPQLDRTLMVERHLISKEHAKGDEPRGVAISLPDEQLSIMVNEEDQLRMQVIRSGLQLQEGFEVIDEVDSRLNGAYDRTAAASGKGRLGPMSPADAAPALCYAFSPRFGYLTACPTNVGTGMRVSVMLHLPALRLTGEMEKVRRATRDMSLAIRGYYGEGSEAAGDFYQVSNQTTLGKPERLILHEFISEILPHVIEYERQARRLMLTKRRRYIEDLVYRALGTLRSARLLTPEESVQLLSQVRLGIATGLITDVAEQTVNQLILLTQPAHLQRALDTEMDQASRREARADLVRQNLTV